MSVRFVRIHGRVVPISDKKGAPSVKEKAAQVHKREYYKGDVKKDYRSTFRLGSIGGALAGAGAHLMTSSSLRAREAGAVLGIAGSLVGLGATVKAVSRGIEQRKGKKGRTFFGHYISGSLGSLAGGLAGFGAAFGGSVAASAFKYRKAGAGMSTAMAVYKHSSRY